MSGSMALVVDQRGAALELGSHGTLVLRLADGRRERVGLRALGSVVLHGDVQLSTGVLQALAAAGAGVAVLPLRGRAPAVGFTQLPHRHAALRHRQHLAYAHPRARLAMARTVVQGKLQAMAAFAGDHAPDAGDAWLPALQAVHEVPDIAALMGVEGAATQRHFAGLKRLYGEDGPFRFDGRNRQPPTDAPNALMSLGYTLAQAQAAQLVLHAGLDVQLGFLHGLQRDRQSLALDLLEPARAAVDGWVLQLLSGRGAITPAMFAPAPDGAMRLTAQGRAAFYPLWFSEGHRRVLRPMRNLLARLIQQLRLLSHEGGGTPSDSPEWPAPQSAGSAGLVPAPCLHRMPG